MSFAKNQLKQMKQKIKSVFNRIRIPLVSLHREIPYINKPITDEKADEIGMDVYVDYLESAIEQGASMISVVSRFGTGKSSLIELLKKKYAGFEKKGSVCVKRVYCQVNLWSHLGKTSSREDDADGTLELHRTFLYQLISALHPRASSYFSKRTSRNFGMLRISTENTFWGVWIRIAALFFVASTLGQHFSELIIERASLEKDLLNQLVLFGYAVCAVIVIFVLLRTEIIFSSKNSEGNRHIEENELIELYREHILVPQKWYRKLWAKFAGVRKIVVVIEDLDRTDDGDSVYEFLKELRKYYVPYEQSEKNFMNQVVFVVNIMPEDLLQEKCKHIPQNQDYIYDKLFDYSLNLNRINIDNFDAVLEAFIDEKRSELEKIGLKVHDSDNTHRMPGMQWIIHGKELSLRQVKARLNDAVLLYESLRTKFGEEYPEFIKCAVVAYLRNTYSKDFYSLSDRELERMLDWYARESGDEKIFLEEFWNTEKSEEFLKELFEMIASHLIDGNYRIYFFNYPRDSHLYTVQETRVRNLIVYDEKVDAELSTQIAEVSKKNPDLIIEALDTVQELEKSMPDVVTYSELIWNVAVSKYYGPLHEKLLRILGNVKEWNKAHYELVDRVCSYNGGPEILFGVISENEQNLITEMRHHLLHHQKRYIHMFAGLFANGESLSTAELEQMEDVPLKTVLKMLPESLASLSDETRDMMCERIQKEQDAENILAAETFYVKMSREYVITEIVTKLFKYMQLRKCLLPELESCIYEGVQEEEIASDIYYDLLNVMPIEQIGEEQLERVHTLNEPGKVSPTICEKQLEMHRISDYLQNQILLDESVINLPYDEVLKTMVREGATIWKYHPQIFSKIRVWMCAEYKDFMVEAVVLFRMPYPLVTEAEIKHIAKLESALKIYDRDRAAEDEEGVFVSYCNRQYRPSGEAFSIFNYIAGMEPDIIESVFYALDMKKVKFIGMSEVRKKRVVKELQLPLQLSEGKNIIRFMNFTKCLLPALEQEIADELKEGEDKELNQSYVNMINTMSEVTDDTIKNILAMPNLYRYSEVINERLFEEKHYVAYVCSKTQEKKSFVVEYERMDVLWDTYLIILKSATGYTYTRSCMYKNHEFLKMIQDRGNYKGFPEESRMAMAHILQDERNLEDALTYGEDFVIRYYSSIAGFQSKQAAEKFINIMKKHPQYAQNSKIYNAVHGKLIDGNLKRTYTNLYKKANGR